MTGAGPGAAAPAVRADAIDFWFDFASPYAYFLSEKIDALAARHGRTVRWRPVLLFAVLRALDLPAPLGNSVKRDYMHRDFDRSARFMGVPFHLPPGFPVTTQLAARAFHLIDRADPAAAVRFAQRVMRGYFRDAAPIDQLALIAGWAAQEAPALGDAAAIETMLALPETKALLGQAVDEAIRREVFGSPFVEVDGESFFGADRLPQIEAALAGRAAATGSRNEAVPDAPPRVLLHKEDAVAVITLNRPDSFNTLDLPMLLAMEAAITAADADPDVRAVVVTGAGDRVFMAGGDIEDLSRRRGLQHYEEFAEVLQRVFRRFEACRHPTIAAVNGWALGGGMEFMLCLDLRLLGERARIGLPEIKLGLFPGGGGSQRLLRQLPLCQAKMLMFCGDAIDAGEALSLGLVNRVVPQDDLRDEAMALARRLAGQPRVALRLLKKSMLHGAEMPLEAALDYERSMISLVFDSEDAHEGTSAFLQKRPASFSHR